MKSVVFRCLLVFLFSYNTYALSMIPIPDKCFDSSLMCSYSSVISKIISGIEEKVINVRIFALLSKDDYVSIDQIIRIFYDFDSWKEALVKSRTDRVKIKKSIKLSPLTIGETLINRQYINYLVKGPAPIFYVPARAVGHYWEVTPAPGAIYSGEFEHLNSGVYEIPGEEILFGSVGYKYHKGDYHISEDLNNYYLHFQAFIVPDIDMLQDMMASFIKGGYEAIVRALYF